MNFLITGGCGFFCTALISRLLSEGEHRVRVIDNLSVGTRQDLATVCDFDEIIVGQAISEFIHEKVQFIEGDILDHELAIKVTKGADVIVHFAANTGVGPSVEDPRSDMRANVIGTFNYLEASRINDCSRFVFASSGAPAGEVEPPIHEELPPHPVSPYGASKLAGEGYCSAYNKTFGIDTVCLRFGNVYGPGSAHKASVVAKFIKAAISGNSLEVYGDGSQTRDFIFIDDLTQAVFLAAMKDGVGGETFQIATNQETTVGEMAKLLVSNLKSLGIDEVKLVNGEKRLGDVQRNFSDISKAKKYLGWQPNESLNTGLEKTIKYFL